MDFFNENAPMPGDFTLRLHRSGPDWEYTWYGRQAVFKSIVAAKLAIDKLDTIMAEYAAENHPWEDRTFQTRLSVFPRIGVEPPDVFAADAEIDWATKEVWGAWGIRERPRLPPPGQEEARHPVSTKDVAMFLEFGTKNMRPYPWLYPSWNMHKGLLPAMIEAEYRTLTPAQWTKFQPRVAGRFASPFG